jgi:Fur family transcriptional regulator, iron response regulator
MNTYDGNDTAAMESTGSTMVIARLRKAGLRPTRQRVALATLLFGEGQRHVTAEELHDEALRCRLPVSLATVYNTLNQFTDAGLLREVAIEGQRSYFDTNTSNHFHFYLESERKLFDIPGGDLQVSGLPELPPGTRVRRVDVIVRLEDANGAGAKTK